MERYAPNALELASRDVVSRAITIEILEGVYYLYTVCVRNDSFLSLNIFIKNLSDCLSLTL